MDRFFVKPNFGHWSVIDSTTNKMIVGYSNKKDADNTVNGLNNSVNNENFNYILENINKKLYGYFTN